MYHNRYHDSGFRVLMIVSRLCYIAILKHVLPSVHCNDANMNMLYIHMINNAWILNLEVPVKFQSHWNSLNSNLMASRLHEIFQKDLCLLSE